MSLMWYLLASASAPAQMEKKNGSALFPFSRANVSPDTELLVEADPDEDELLADPDEELKAARPISTGTVRAANLISGRLFMTHSSRSVVNNALIGLVGSPLVRGT